MVTYLVSSMLLNNERKLLSDYTSSSAETLRNFLRSSLNLRVAAANGFALGLDASGPTSEAAWKKEANALIASIDGLDSLKWVNPEGKVEWIVPESIPPTASDIFPFNDQRRFTGPKEIMMGSSGFCYIYPVTQAGKPRGSIVATFRYREMLESVFKTASANLQVQVFHNGTRVFHKNADTQLELTVRHERGFSILNSEWQIVVQPTKRAVGEYAIKSSFWVFVLGIFITTLFTSRLRSMILSSESERRAKAAFVALQRETESRLKAERAFRSLVEQTSAVTGEAFFATLVKALCDTLEMPIALLGEVSEENTHMMKIVSLYLDGKHEAMRYKEVDHTPCADTIKCGSLFIPLSLMEDFPKATMIQQSGFQSYFGTTLRDSSGKLMGVLSVLDRKPMSENNPARFLVPLFAGRCAAELETLRAKSALTQSERIYRGAIENASGVPYLHLYATEEYDFVGDGVRQLLGVSPEEFTPAYLRQRVLEVQVADSDSKDDPATYGHQFRRGELVNYRTDFRFRLDSGEEKWISDSSVLLRDETTGQPYGDLGVMQDITLRKNAEQALRLHAQEIAQWKRRYDAAVEASGQVLYDWDARTDTIVWGNFFEATFGYAPTAEHSKRSWWESKIHPQDVARYRDAVSGALANRSSFKISYRVLCESGDYLHIEDSGSVLIDAEGVVDRLVGFITNITPRIREEEERRALEAKIQDAHKLESLGLLAGGIAHDFNNLLVAIMGNAGLAMMELEENSSARPILSSIERAAQRAADLANQMLAYSGRGRFVIERINLNSLVDEMTHLLEITISKKAVLQYRLAKNLPPLEADPTQVRQIIMNLVTNASDAIGESAGTITVSTGMVYADRAYLKETTSQGELDENYYVYVEVSDTGCGMDQAKRQKIFEPFFTTKATGRGLGLAALLGIVRGHKGGVKVESEPGIGTTIRILLPSLGSWTPEPDPAPVTTPAPANQPIDDGGLVLVVDDEDSVRMVTCNILAKFGYKTISAVDGKEAVDIFLRRYHEIAAVVMDMTMPVMDGAEAFREMRRICPDVCVILSSGYNEQEAVDRIAGKGMAGFLQKPYRANELIEKVRTTLRGKGRRQGMTDLFAVQKTPVRKEMRTQLKDITAEYREQAALQLQDQLWQLNAIPGRHHILAFHPHGNEIDCRPFCRAWIAAGHQLSLPRVDDDGVSLVPHLIHDIAALKLGYRGIPEPDARECPITKLEDIDALLLPGLAFDRRGNRLGQGGGHYDRLLSRLPASCVTIGLAYDWQVIDSVPAGPHDQRMQWVVTPLRTIKCQP